MDRYYYLKLDEACETFLNTRGAINEEDFEREFRVRCRTLRGEGWYGQPIDYVLDRFVLGSADPTVTADALRFHLSRRLQEA